MKKRIVIFGAGTQVGIIIDLIERIGDYQIWGLIDSKVEIGSIIGGYRVIGRQENIKELAYRFEIYGGIISVGDNFSRFVIAESIEKEIPNFNWINAIHPSCSIAKGVEFGVGIVAMSGCSFEVNAKIGDFTAFYTGAKIQHDNIISNFASISAGSTLGGKVSVGEFSAICLGVTIFDRISIKSNTIVGSGSLVTKDLEGDSLYYGNPCKFIRKRNLGDKYLK